MCDHVGDAPQLRRNWDRQAAGPVASSSSVTRGVLLEISIESQIEIPTHKRFICG